MVCTRFDITAAVSIVSKYLHNRKKSIVIWWKIYFYLRGTTEHSLIYTKSGATVHKSFCDASFANLKSCNSFFGHVF